MKLYNRRRMPTETNQGVRSVIEATLRKAQWFVFSVEPPDKPWFTWPTLSGQPANAWIADGFYPTKTEAEAVRKILQPESRERRFYVGLIEGEEPTKLPCNCGVHRHCACHFADCSARNR
jgi:hypothetical protein